MFKYKAKRIIQIILILILSAFTLINIKLTCMAKYEINYTITVAEIKVECN